jgi:hypothetical protein
MKNVNVVVYCNFMDAHTVHQTKYLPRGESNVKKLYLEEDNHNLSKDLERRKN